MNITKKCPFCGKVNTKEFDTKEVRAYESGKNILEAMPTRDVFDREFMITGMCESCASKTFNVPIPGDDSWGVFIGECPCCGCSIYSVKNIRDNGDYECPTCHTVSRPDGEEMVEVED